jgi:LemA protein
MSIFILLLIIFGVITAVFSIAMLWAIGTYNSFINRKTMVQEGFSGIDVQLKRRYDLIPNLVAVVKQYSIHEKGIFEDIARSRANALQAKGIEAKAEAEKELTQTLRTLFAVAENYPTLKANENFLALQKELSTIEHEIQLSRRYYNGVARDYNMSIAFFPASIIANMSGFSSVDYFELNASVERENPRVQF